MVDEGDGDVEASDDEDEDGAEVKEAQRPRDDVAASG